MIYLLGICHSIQTKVHEASSSLLSRQGRYADYLKEVVRSLNIDCIAEELNEEIEATRGASMAREIAANTNPTLRYLPCEPNNHERAALGIPTGDEIIRNTPSSFFGRGLEQYRDVELLRHFPRREKYWLSELNTSLPGPILFVVGADHIRTFTCRLVENGIPCDVVCFDWCASDDQEYGIPPLEERLI